VLGVTRTASEQEIKAAYRKLALQHHPDRNPGDAGAEDRFKEASEAYSVLADANKRAQYDRFGHAGVSGAGGGIGFDADVIFRDFGDIFGDFFGFGDIFGTGGGRRSRAQRGVDLRADVDLDFEEAVFGTKHTVKYRRQQACEECHGTGAAPGKNPVTCSTCGGRGQVRYQQGFFSVSRTCPACHGAGTVINDPCPRCKGQGVVSRERTQEVKVPAGVEDGTRIRYSELGDAGVHGGPPGDLYVVLHVKEHPYFMRDGKDIYCVLPISFPQAALGAEVKVPTLDGEHLLKIPEGTQSGKELRIRGKGVPVLNGHGKGDMIVRVVVQTPNHLTKRERELLQELDAINRVDNKPERPSLLSKVKDIFG
jgi:molecular chaperone DnaJ